MGTFSCGFCPSPIRVKINHCDLLGFALDRMCVGGQCNAARKASCLWGYFLKLFEQTLRLCMSCVKMGGHPTSLNGFCNRTYSLSFPIDMTAAAALIVLYKQHIESSLPLKQRGLDLCI